MTRQALRLGLLMLALAPAQAAPPPPTDDSGGRIVNGTQADLKTAPWQLLLKWSDRDAEGKLVEWGCGAVLIDWDWVLTARHCVVAKGFADKKTGKVYPFDEAAEDRAKGAITISGGHLGANQPTKDDGHAQFRKVDRVLVADDAKLEAGYNQGDLALLRLVRKFDKVAYSDDSERYWPAKIALFDGIKPLDGKDARVSGWGTTSWQPVDCKQANDASACAQKSTNTLLYADLKVLDQASCTRRLGLAAKGGLPAKLLCAWKEDKTNARGNATTCQGDSGGPLALIGSDGSRHLIGLVSSAPGCGPFPAVYVRVSAYVAWIREKMKAPA